jgi:IS1 family transposase
VARSAVSAE